jgi:succinate dehydrogenase / fumarate reductase, cytochrome b subunit
MPGQIMSSNHRPLSPHLQIYKPQLTSVLSITHRMTGIFLGAGTLPLICWLLALAAGPDAYAATMAVL